MNDSYVYVIFTLAGAPCYVGKGRGARWLVHNRGQSHNKRLTRIINKYGRLPIIKIREGLSEAESAATEIALIAAIGRGKNGPLVNMTDGGEGAAGRDMRAVMARPEVRAKCSAAKLGRKLSVEHRAAIGAAHVGTKRSAEARATMSAAAKKRGVPLHVIEKFKFAAIGYKHTEDARLRISAALRKRSPISEETRTKLKLAALNRKPISEETRTRMSISASSRRLSSRVAA